MNGLRVFVDRGRFAALPGLARYTVSLLMILVLTSGWYYTAYKRLQHQLFWHVETLNKLQRLTQKIDEQQQRTASMNRDKEQARQALMKEVSRYNKSYIEHQIVFDTAFKSGLHLESYTPNQTIDKGWLIQKSCLVTVRGTFDQLIAWLEQLQKRNLLVQCKRYRISDTAHGLQCDGQFNFYHIKNES